MVDAELIQTIAARRQAIEDDARCIGCSATLASCKANRGKDPTAPAWFGCCARGTEMSPCRHEPSTARLTGLLIEIESGHVLTVEETMLAMLDEHSGTKAHLWRLARRMARQIAPEDMLQLAHPARSYAEED